MFLSFHLLYEMTFFYFSSFFHFICYMKYMLCLWSIHVIFFNFFLPYLIIHLFYFCIYYHLLFTRIRSYTLSDTIMLWSSSTLGGVCSVRACLYTIRYDPNIRSGGVCSVRACLIARSLACIGFIPWKGCMHDDISSGSFCKEECTTCFNGKTECYCYPPCRLHCKRLIMSSYHWALWIDRRSWPLAALAPCAKRHILNTADFPLKYKASFGDLGYI